MSSNPNPDQSAPKNDPNSIESNILWGRTGFFRPLGGFWHNYLFNLGIMIFGLLFMGIIFPRYILPYPEAIGFKSVVGSLFALMFNVFDLGIGSAVTRFVAEYVGKGQIKKSLEYLRFFIWFQMITGLCQITIIAMYSFYYARYINEFASLIWVFLFNSVIQFPGMLGIYKSALEAFQRYDKKNIVAFIQTVVFEVTTQIIFIFIGRAWGVANPQFGEMMGATLGYVIGLYIDDFFAMLLSAHFFADVLKPYKISIIETLIPKFDVAVIKQSLKFGLKNLGQNIFYQISNLFITAVTIWWLPNYATIIGLFTIADTIARICIQDLPMTASVAEAYNSGKKHLTDFYIQSQFKWYGQLTFFLALEILMLIPPVIGIVADNYAGAAWMIPYLLVSRIFIGPIHFSDGVQQGCDKPEYAAYSLMVQMFARLAAFFLLLSPWMLPSLIPKYNYGVAYLLADLPSILAKNIFAWWIIDRKIIKVRVNWWQTIIAPLIAILPLIPINLGLLALFKVASAQGIIGSVLMALFMIVMILFGIPIIIIFPISGLIGGWDTNQLEQLHLAAKLSGPSKFLVMLLYNGANWGFNHSPLKSKEKQFMIPYEDAAREAQEINLARDAVHH